MNQYSVLQNFTPECLKLDPFPYIHIPQVLPWPLYEKLEAEYPEQHVTGGTDTGFGTARYRQHEFDYVNVVSDTWREFIAYNTSRDFKDELIRAFRTAIVEHYNTNKGWKEDLYTKYTRADVSPRMEPKKGSIRMEMQFARTYVRQIFMSSSIFRKCEDIRTGMTVLTLSVGGLILWGGEPFGENDDVGKDGVVFAEGVGLVEVGPVSFSVVGEVCTLEDT